MNDDYSCTYTNDQVLKWDQRITLRPPPYIGALRVIVLGIHEGDEWVDQMPASHLACHGRKVDIPQMDEPSWVDWNKIERGQKLWMDRLSQYFGALSLSLLAGFSIARFAEVLYRTGYAQDGLTAMKRYQATGHAVVDWISLSLRDENSRARKSLYNVRAMHGLARRNSKKYFSVDRGEGVPLSQYDMAEVLLGFSGISLMFLQKELGYGEIPEKDVEDMVFLWRFIGYHLGIRDEYNVCRSVTFLNACVNDYMSFTPRRLETLRYASSELRRTAIEGFAMQTGMGVQYWAGASSIIFAREELRAYRQVNMNAIVGKRKNLLPNMDHISLAVFKLLTIPRVNALVSRWLLYSREVHATDPEKASKLRLFLARSSRLHDQFTWPLCSAVVTHIRFLIFILVVIALRNRLFGSPIFRKSFERLRRSFARLYHELPFMFGLKYHGTFVRPERIKLLR